MWLLHIDNKSIAIDYNPKPTFAYGLLGEVGQINSIATREIQIAKSPEAKKIFEDAHLFNNQTDMPRRAMSVSLTYNGDLILLNARIESFFVAKKSFNLILSSGNRNLKDILSGKLTELDYSAYDVPFDTRFPFWSVGDESGYLLMQYAQGQFIEVSKALPAITFKAILDTILDQKGLILNDLSTIDWANNAQFFKSCFQMTTQKMPFGFDSFNVSGLGSPVTYPAGKTQINFSGVTTTSGGFVFYQGGTNEIFINTPHLFDIDLKFNITGSFTLVIDVYRAGVFHQNIDSFIPTHNVLATRRIDMTTFQAGDSIRVFADVSTSATVQPTEFSGTNENISEVTEITGNVYSFNKNVPDISQIDFLEFLANQLGLFIDFDDETQTIVTTDYQYYLDRLTAGEVIDLSNKIANYQTGIQMDFTGGFAKTNTYRYTNQKPVLETTGGYDLIFDSANVPISRSYYKAPFGIADIGNTDQNLTVMPYIKPNDDLTEWNLQSISPFYVMRGIYTVDPAPYADAAKVKLSASESTLFADNIATFQTDFLAQLDGLKIITLEAKLDNFDIKEINRMDIRKPILINVPEIQGVFKLNSVKYNPTGLSELSLTDLKL